MIPSICSGFARKFFEIRLLIFEKLIVLLVMSMKGWMIEFNVFFAITKSNNKQEM